MSGEGTINIDMITGGIVVAAVVFIMLFFYLDARRLRSRLSEQKKVYETIINNSHSLSIVWSTDLTYIDFNRRMEEIVNPLFTPLDVSLIPKIFGDERECGREAWLKNALNDAGRSFKFIANDGGERHIMWNSVILEKLDDEVYHLLSVGTDITEIDSLKTELMESNYVLKVSEELYNIAMESAEIGIVSDDINKRNGFYLSDFGRSILGFTMAQVLTMDDFAQKIHEDDREAFRESLRDLKNKIRQSFSMETRCLAEEDKLRYFMIRFKSVYDESGEVSRLVGAFMDITTPREIRLLVEKNMFEDSLTGIMNRRKFFLEGESFLLAAKELDNMAALILFDIDRFQRINTLCGYDIGDQVLKDLAQAVSALLPEQSLFARLDSDNFAILMRFNDFSFVHNTVQSICEYVSKMTVIGILKEQIRVSVGIGIEKEGKVNIYPLFDKAHMALDIAKSNQSKPYEIYNNKVKRMTLEFQMFEQELFEAYEKEQFILHYQPKVLLEEKQLVSLEALIRWRHPRKGLIYPDKFIHIAEENGFITNIDAWGMKQACIQNKFLQDNGFPRVTMAVNISQKQLYEADLLQCLKEALGESGLEAKWLEIELTETMAMKNLEKSIEILTKVKNLGVGITMDDFGSGYSSLSMLKDLPVDMLKIDRSLIADIQENHTSMDIVSAIISMCKSLKIEFLAEGIETREQSDILMQLGCKYGQGYYYGRPMDFESLSRRFGVTV